MASRRALKAAQAIREVVGMAILTDLRDPRIKNVTVTRVEVSPDMQNAKVYVSVMGDEASQNRAVLGLQNSAGYLQQKVSNRVEMRYTPRLNFELDLGIKNAIAVEQILKQVLPQEPSPADEEPVDDEPAADDVPAGDSPEATSDEQPTADEPAETPENPES